MSNTELVIHCFQYVIFLVAGFATGISVFDSSAMAIYLMSLAVFIANIAFYVETIAKEMRGG